MAFCMNGLINADYKPFPALTALKYYHQPAHFKWSAQQPDELELTNRYDFTDLSTVAHLSWQLWSTDGVLAAGKVALPSIAPGETASVKLEGLPAALSAPASAGEIWLDVALRQSSPTALLEAGHELAYEQFAVSGTWQLPEAPVAGDSIEAEQYDGRILLSGDDWSMRFTRTARGLDHWKARGKLLVDRPVLPDYWRAATDNDQAAGLSTPPLMNKHLGPSHIYKTALDTWQPTLELSQNANTTVIRFAGKLLDGKARQEVTYTVYPDGALEVGFAYEALQELPQMMRVGTQWSLPREFDQIHWYGRGPEPTYRDRDEAPIGLYRTSLMENWIDYARPQENGNKVDVRWIEVTNAHGVGLRVEGAQALSVNLLPWDAATLEAADYSWQLPEPRAAFLNIDLAQMGVGGDNSWGRIAHPQYRLRDKAYSYRYRVTPIQ